MSQTTKCGVCMKDDMNLFYYKYILSILFALKIQKNLFLDLFICMGIS